MTSTSAPRIVYLDCVSGVSGDMLVGALLDLGAPLSRVKKALAALPLRGYRVRSARVTRGGLAATRFIVEAGHEHAHRGRAEIERILDRARIPAAVRERARGVVRRLVAAEARVHRIPEARVHLHEVGAVDAIVDIVAASACLEILGAPRLECSPLPLGGGSVRAEHGTLPVPVPATLELLRGVPVRPGPVEAELVTPTGAALVTAFAARFGAPPAMTIEKVGHGAGAREIPGHPNLLRAWWGFPAHDPARAEIRILEATLDDLNPQVYGYVMERLFEGGALDVHFTPAQMKKNRPGTLITVLARPPAAAALEQVLFEETSTLGVRSWTATRRELERRSETVSTPFGKIPVKIATGGGERALHAAPEYEACARAARRHGVPLKEVQQAALATLAGARRRTRS